MTFHNTSMIKDHRYQYQPWYIKFCRNRFMLLVPYYALPLWWYETCRFALTLDPDCLSLETCWRLAKGMLQHDMGYWYTAEELGLDVSGELEEESDCV